MPDKPKCYLMRWNPTISSFTEKDYEECVANMQNGMFRLTWSIREWEEARRGDLFFMLRTGDDKETFTEFATRVRAFRDIVLPVLPNETVIFGHGTWIALLLWMQLGFNPLVERGMRRFRSFQQGLPMPNTSIWCAQELTPGHWRAQILEDKIDTVMEQTINK